MKLPDLNSVFAFAITAACCLACGGCNLSFTLVDGYSFDRTGETAEYSEQGTFDDGVKNIKIHNKFGDVKISLADGEPGWTWESKVWAETQELADQYIDELIMDVQTDGDTQTWTISIPEKSSDLNGIESNLTLKVPVDIATKLENRHGNVVIRNLTSDVDLENTHGDVELKSLTGNVVATNAHGDISVNEIAKGIFQNSHGNTQIQDSTSDIEVKSSHGHVTAQRIQGNLTFEGSHGDFTGDASGNVNAQNRHGSTQITTSGEKIKVTSVHGDIHLTVYSDSFKSIDLETTHSSIDLLLPPSSQPFIAMSTSHGKLHSEFESNPSSDQRIHLNNQHGNIKITKTESIAEMAE